MKWKLLVLMVLLLPVYGRSTVIDTTKADNRERYISFIPIIGTLSTQVSKFIPKGYVPLDTAIGDVNQDGINDLLLVVRGKGEDTVFYPTDEEYKEHRSLSILLGQQDGSYIQARRNDNLVMCINCSGVVRSDPFTGLKIKNGFFSVEHGVAEGPQHWETVTTFKYDREKKEWYLFKIGSVSQFPNDDTAPNADAMKTYTETKTKKDFGLIPFEKYDLDKK